MIMLLTSVGALILTFILFGAFVHASSNGKPPGVEMGICVCLMSALLVLAFNSFYNFVEQRTYDKVYTSKATLKLKSISKLGTRFYMLKPNKVTAEKEITNESKK